ncbi:MAG: flagellar biosynthetic protein FliO [Desulfovibrio sp.]|jgi:flagellar biosynthetic protein FliO|nr:flagellar biosynthetic protein FliO [Desulfovibrio sp.]
MRFSSTRLLEIPAFALRIRKRPGRLFFFAQILCALCAARVSFAADAQNATDSPSLPPPAGQIPDVSLSWSGYFEALALLCLLVALLWGLLWFIRKRGMAPGLFASQGNMLRVENRLPLGPKKWILAIRCLDRHLIVGVTERNISLLTEIFREEAEANRPDEADEPEDRVFGTKYTTEPAAGKTPPTLKPDERK